MLLKMHQSKFQTKIIEIFPYFEAFRRSFSRCTWIRLVTTKVYRIIKAIYLLFSFLKLKLNTSSVPKKSRIAFFGFVYAENDLILAFSFSGKLHCHIWPHFSTFFKA
jgi:hypothetical protein